MFFAHTQVSAHLGPHFIHSPFPFHLEILSLIPQLGLRQLSQTCRKKYGSWGLVTDPTDGIGKGFAFELVRKGLNLVLVGRNGDKLKDVSDSIQGKYSKTQIKYVVVDFSGDLDGGGERIKKIIKGLDVGVLINNDRYMDRNLWIYVIL